MNWLNEQIRTILFQKGILVKIFISVDLSNDKTYELCKELENKNHNVKVLPYGKKFGSAAKNFFHLINEVSFVGFDYIAFSDQDDIWKSNKLQHATKLIKQNGLDGYSSDIISLSENGKENLVKKSYPQKKYDFYFESAGPGCTYVFKKQSIQKFKKFLVDNWKEVNLLEFHDWLIYAYFRTQKMKWKIDNIPLMYYRQHRNNVFGANIGYKAFLRRFYKIRSKWYRNEVQKIFHLTNKGLSNKFSLKRIFLFKNITQLRRRTRDKFLLLFMLIFYVF